MTSQIFANIYLNELDRFVKHELKIKYYVRYGDDFVIVHSNQELLKEYRQKIIAFTENVLALKLHKKNDIIIRATQGVRYLGVVIWPNITVLNRRTLKRIRTKVNHRNYSSYSGLVVRYGTNIIRRQFMWQLYVIFFNV